MLPSNIQLKAENETVDVADHSADGASEPIMAEIPVLTVSWDLEADETDYSEVVQSAYRVAVYRNGECLYETGKVEGYEQSCRIINPPERLKPDDYLFVCVSLWDGNAALSDTVLKDM